MVLNVSAGLREIKKYAYALSGKSDQYQEIKEDVQRKLSIVKNKVFYFNNEMLCQQLTRPTLCCFCFLPFLLPPLFSPKKNKTKCLK